MNCSVIASLSPEEASCAKVAVGSTNAPHLFLEIIPVFPDLFLRPGVAKVTAGDKAIDREPAEFGQSLCMVVKRVSVSVRLAFDHGGYGLHMPDDHFVGRLAVSDGIFDRVFCLGGGKSQRQHR